MTGVFLRVFLGAARRFFVWAPFASAKGDASLRWHDGFFEGVFDGRQKRNRRRLGYETPPGLGFTP
jgi:hypothetical protein